MADLYAPAIAAMTQAVAEAVGEHASQRRRRKNELGFI